MKVELATYDVWGNAKDGYEVNAAYTAGTFEDDKLNLDSDRSIMEFLKRIGYLNKYAKLKSLEIEGEPEFSIYIGAAKDGYPLWEIRQVTD